MFLNIGLHMENRMKIISILLIGVFLGGASVAGVKTIFGDEKGIIRENELLIQIVEKNKEEIDRLEKEKKLLFTDFNLLLEKDRKNIESMEAIVNELSSISRIGEEDENALQKISEKLISISSSLSAIYN